MARVGIFDLEPLTPGRWRVMNTTTRIEHVTYGTEEEVTKMLTIQSEAWQRKLAPGHHGDGWRRQIQGEAIAGQARARAARKAV